MKYRIVQNAVIAEDKNAFKEEIAELAFQGLRIYWGLGGSETYLCVIATLIIILDTLVLGVFYAHRPVKIDKKTTDCGIDLSRDILISISAIN